MRFKLQNFVWIVIFLVVPELLSAQEVQAHSYHGVLPGLSSTSVKKIALARDGRYLIYSDSLVTWNVIDLQDFITRGSQPKSVEGLVRGIFVSSPTEVIIASTDGLQYFDINNIYAPEEKTQLRYKRSESSDYHLVDVCRTDNGNFFFLEFDLDEDANNHFVRILDSDHQEQTRLQWRDLFNLSGLDVSEVLPLGLKCAPDLVVVMAIVYPKDSNDPHLIYLRNIRAAGGLGAGPLLFSPDLEQEYEIKDLVLDAKRERVLGIFNRLEPNNNEQDLIGIEYGLSNLSNPKEMRLGSGGRIVASFLRAAQSFYAFFVERDYLGEILGELPQEKLLQIPVNSFGRQNYDFGERGSGSSNVGNSQIGEKTGKLPNNIFSEWLSSNNDYYTYGVLSDHRVHLLTSAPRLEILENSGNLELSESNPLQFQIRSDLDANYEIRFEEDWDPDGNRSGITHNLGRKIAEGGLEANKSKRIKISPKDLKVKKDGIHRILVFASRKFANEGDPVSRIGLAFNYDSLPPAIENFRLGYGDRSLHVFFDLSRDPGDLKYFLIYVSERLSDLDELPRNQDELKAWDAQKHFIRDMNGKKIHSPIRVSASKWNGHYVIDPLINDQPIYVRVQIQDAAGNLSINNPAAIKGTPRVTKSLVSAFGANSCALQPKAKFSIFAVLGFLFLFLWRALRKSKIEELLKMGFLKELRRIL